MSDEDKQLDVYDEFREYAHAYLRDKNPKLTLEDFSRAKIGPTHITVKFVYCSGFDSKMHELVQKFEPSASLASRAKVMEEGNIYKVHLPWTDRKQKPKKRKRREYDDEDEEDEQSIIELMGYGMAFIFTCFAAALTTDKAQWVRLLG